MYNELALHENVQLVVKIFIHELTLNKNCDTNIRNARAF